MRHKRLIRCALGAGLVLSFGIFGKHMISSSTTMGSETELAGMGYTLDQYCTIQVGANQSDPEAIVAFEDTSNSDGTSTVSGSAVAGATPEPTIEATATSTPKPESEYANVGISIAADYVNIRKKPSTDSDIVGKLYRGSAATISRTEGDWVYIKSGSVSGYIMKDYLAIGYSAEKLIDQFGTKWATVTTETLRVREKNNENSKILDLLPGEESYEVLKEESQWVKIRVDGDTSGYVSKDYVKISVQFKKAVSVEEEREEERRKQAAAAAAAEAEREAKSSSSSSHSSSSHSLTVVLPITAAPLATRAVRRRNHLPAMAVVVEREVPAVPVTVPAVPVDQVVPAAPAMVLVVPVVEAHPMAVRWEVVMVLQLPPMR